MPTGAGERRANLRLESEPPRKRRPIPKIGPASVWAPWRSVGFSSATETELDLDAVGTRERQRQAPALHAPGRHAGAGGLVALVVEDILDETDDRVAVIRLVPQHPQVRFVVRRRLIVVAREHR